MAESNPKFYRAVYSKMHTKRARKKSIGTIMAKKLMRRLVEEEQQKRKEVTE